MTDLPKPIPPPGPWIKQAACRDVWPYELRDLLFFPYVRVRQAPRGTTPEEYEELRAKRAEKDRHVLKGKSICMGCPVRKECALYAAQNRITHGTWGGMSEWERKSKAGRPRRDLPDEVILAAGLDFCPYCGKDAVAPRGSRQAYCLACQTAWQIPRRRRKSEGIQPADDGRPESEVGRGGDPVPPVQLDDQGRDVPGAERSVAAQGS